MAQAGAGAGVPVLPPAEFALFEQAGRPRLACAGERLYARGDLGDSMFVVVQGTVEMDYGDDQLPLRIGRHGYFGSLGMLIGDHARPAGALAVGSTVLVEVAHAAMPMLAERDPLLLVAFLQRASAGVVRRDQELVGHLRARNAALQGSLDALGAVVRRIDRAGPVRPVPTASR